MFFVYFHMFICSLSNCIAKNKWPSIPFRWSYRAVKAFLMPDHVPGNFPNPFFADLFWIFIKLYYPS